MHASLETERLLLRRFAEADVDRLLALHNDPEVMRFLNGGKPTSREEVEREYREHFAGDGYWAAVEKATGEFVGWFVLQSREGGAPEGHELGYRLKRSAWGKGYATEGSLALVKKGFADLGVRRVWAQTMAVNAASRRVMEKAGLVYVRTFHLEWEDPLPGTEHGEVEYALTRDAWGGREADGPGPPGGTGEAPPAQNAARPGFSGQERGPE
ncbi:MAG: Acetyltransferase, GNAT family [uncultured Rubrobacteraceae bacterium]|uniref:Acetyltransferase, GNAT family n=1 Tax=uncultured Rubrobacteraceae bacterium TaxID=349277 RepID=A0A6J4PVC2_9ACTN|nr:MAG: Acetyltransferase, GNAT family [uncultured Rubrobacteraceae bacterium]